MQLVNVESLPLIFFMHTVLNLLFSVESFIIFFVGLAKEILPECLDR